MSEQEIQDHCVVLGLDASGDQASVALWRDGAICDYQIHTARHGHAATLIPMAQALMQANACAFDALTHIAGGTGPGSFTGVRVALAGAKGLCVATKAQGVGVCVLAAQAFYAAQTDANQKQPMVMLTDTRRGSVYGQWFDRDGAELGSIFESELRDLAAHMPVIDGAQPADFAIGGAHSDEAMAQIGGSVMGELDPADARHITMLAAAQITAATASPDKGLPPLVPQYLAPAFLGPKKAAE